MKCVARLTPAWGHLLAPSVTPSSGFHRCASSITFNDGNRVPQVGLGTWKSPPGNSGSSNRKFLSWDGRSFLLASIDQDLFIFINRRRWSRRSSCTRRRLPSYRLRLSLPERRRDRQSFISEAVFLLTSWRRIPHWQNMEHVPFARKGANRVRKILALTSNIVLGSPPHPLSFWLWRKWAGRQRPTRRSIRPLSRRR